MKNIIKNLIAILMAFSFANAYAQVPVAPDVPPDEVAEEMQDMVPTGLAPEEAVAKDAVKEEVVEEKGTVLSLTPSIMIKPVAVDKDVSNYNYYLAIEPSIEFGADFLTATKKKLNLSLGYTMIFEQYFDAGYERYFEHDLTASISYSLTDKWSISSTLLGYLGHFYSAANQGSNENAFEGLAGVKYSITKELSIGLSYYWFFFYDPNVMLGYNDINSISNPPSDIEDFNRGTGGVYDSYAGSYNPYYPQFAAYPDPSGESLKFMLHGIILEGTYKFTSSTTGTFKWHYYPATSSNSDDAEYTGHQLYFIINQGLWKGGSLNAQYRLRRISCPWAYTALGNYKVAYRHRIYLTLSHTLNDYISFEGFYRIAHTQSNDAASNNRQDGYVGIKLSF